MIPMKTGWKGQVAVGLAGGALCAAALFGSATTIFGGGASLATGLAAPPRSAFGVPAPRALVGARYLRRWAAVVAPTAARTRPSRAAAIVSHLSTTTPEATANIVLALRTVRDDGEIWVKALIPGLPGHTEGWIPRGALGGFQTVDTLFVVNLERLTASLYAGGRRVLEARIGIGEAGSPTPPGIYYIRDRIKTLKSPLYGPLAFGTSVRSAVETDWPGGGFIGIHGTNQPGLIPGRVSHGCIRLRNAVILRLGRLMPVGTPLLIV
jgi:hypothetical protein